MSKPTPGPWKLEDCQIVEPFGGLPIAAPLGYRDPDEDEANAAVIVALYNAAYQINPSNPQAVADGLTELIGAAAYLRGEVKNVGNCFPERCKDCLLESLCAALAKIEGKE